MKTTKYATINGRDYRVIVTNYGNQITSTVVQVHVIFSDDNGAVWRALPWFAHERIQKVLSEAR